MRDRGGRSPFLVRIGQDKHVLGARLKPRKRSDIRHEHLADGPGFEVGQARGCADWNIFAREARRQFHSARFVGINEYDSDQRADKHPRAANASPLACKRVIADTRKLYRRTLRATVLHLIANCLLRLRLRRHRTGYARVQ
jgi:hypothetical protein